MDQLILKAWSFSLIVLVVALIQMACVGIAAYCGRPGIAAMGAAILTGTAFSAGILMALPGVSGITIALVIAAMAGWFTYALMMLSFKKSCYGMKRY